MIALAALVLLQAPPADVACVSLESFEVRNSELQSALVAEGSLLNLTPWDLGAVSVEVVILGDNKFPLVTLPREVLGRLPARRGAAVLLKSAQLPQATRFTARVLVRYTVEGDERVLEFDGPRLRAGKFFVDPEPGPKLGLLGLRSIAGSYRTVNKQQVYSGDTLFLRLRVEGFEDKARPDGQLEVAFLADGKKQGTIKRSIDPAHFKVDARKFPTNDADPKMIGYDPESRELVVGLRKQGEDAKPAKLILEVKFSGKGLTWTWAGLESPYLEAPKPPDKKP